MCVAKALQQGMSLIFTNIWREKIMGKISKPNLVIRMKQPPRFEWCVDHRMNIKNKHISKKEWTMCSKFATIQNILIKIKIFIKAPKIM